MPKYRIGDETFRRKTFYMPCALGPRFEQASDEEQVRLFKSTYWSDNITNSEWPVVLRRDDATAPSKSRLKRKAAGWLMALARIAVLHPELFEAIAKQAREMYADQVGEKYPWHRIAPALAALEIDELPVTVALQLVRNPDEDDEL